jgi:sigma-E factor negative regulatory protein RseC
MANKALLLAFGVPFLVLVCVLVLVLKLTGNEGVAALSGLLALVPYYLVLYFFRRRIREQLSFYIESIL